MRTMRSRHLPNPRWSLFRASVAALISTWLAVTPVQGAFHLWQIREIYTDACGTNQFIELFCPNSGKTLVNGQLINTPSGENIHTFTLNHGLPGGADILNKSLLFGTASITNLGAPNLDYVLPENFIFAGGGSISFFG